MSDPEAEAVVRAEAAWTTSGPMRYLALAAAREALAPIRRWIELERSRINADANYAGEINDGAMLARLEDQRWLLRDLARLVYSSDELGGE